MDFVKSSKEHISHTLTSCMYVYINVTVNENVTQR